MEDVKLYQGDCMKVMRQRPDSSADLVITDPPYNIGVKTKKNGKETVNKWDRIENYILWCIQWLKECERILKDNGVLYFWHNDIAQIAELLQGIKKETNLEFISFCIWDKGDGYRAKHWHKRDPKGKTAPRSWFNICEYCIHFFKAPQSADKKWRKTGLDYINSNPACYRPIKNWYKKETERLGLTKGQIEEAYTKATGKKPYMLRHYFNDNQFEIPTREVYEEVYIPLGFKYISDEIRDYEALRQDYEALRQDYEALRPYHRCDAMHCNIWHEPPVPANNRYHTCQKPIKLLERIIRVSSRPNDIIIDPFMGSGSTGVAAIKAGRKFIGIEMDQGYFEIAQKRIQEEMDQYRLAYTE